MKKKLSLLILTLLVSTSLVACGQKTEQTSQNTTTQVQEQQTTSTEQNSANESKEVENSNKTQSNNEQTQSSETQDQQTNLTNQNSENTTTQVENTEQSQSNNESASSQKKYKDGTYTGSAEGFKSTITVSVTIANDEITSVDIIEQGDDGKYMRRAENITSSIIESQSADVDTVSGATFSSNGIKNAVKNALEQAKN